MRAGVPKAELNANRRGEQPARIAVRYVRTISPRVVNEAARGLPSPEDRQPAGRCRRRDVPVIAGGRDSAVHRAGRGRRDAETHVLQLMDNVTWQAARRLFKFGGDIRKNLVDDMGSWRHRELPLGEPRRAAARYSADASGAARARGDRPASWTRYSVNGFVQDEFELTNRFTVNLGLRYEFNSLPRDLATQEEQAIGSVPGVIEFESRESRRTTWRRGSASRGTCWAMAAPPFAAGTGSRTTRFSAPSSAAASCQPLCSRCSSRRCLPNCPIPVPSASFLAARGHSESACAVHDS